ncbi:MAG: hypothetical protein H6730_01120 [Deltaproteobacteria bacterium]|nr:hypothetical protein [Deltaproteobacteria bacterium]
MLLLACGPAELRGPASAVDIQARIDAPTASVHDEAAVRAVLGRGVAVGSAQGGGFQLTIVVANIERFGLPTGPGGGVCPDPDLATTAAVEAHYDTLQTALTEMHDADLSLTIDQGFTQDCQLSDASDAIAKWRFVAHHAIMGSSYTSQVSASVRLNEAQRAAATPEPYLIVSGAYASEATLEAGESGWALATSSARVNYDVECARRARSGLNPLCDA